MKRTFFILLLLSLLGCSTNPETVALEVTPKLGEDSSTSPSSLVVDQELHIFPSPRDGLIVTGYLPFYQVRRTPLNRLKHLTDLVYFGVQVSRSGEVLDHRFKSEHKTYLKEARRLFGTRVLLGLVDHPGSRKRGALSVLSSDPHLRQTFVQNMVAYLRSHGFSGLDVDWEYPKDALDLANYTLLLRDLKEAFQDHNLLLTVAISPWHPLESEAYAFVDRLHVMTYDEPGQHSTLKKTLGRLKTLLAQGVPARKILLGVPFYGRGYTSKGPRWSQALSYQTLRQRYVANADVDTVDGYFFNGVDTVRSKVKAARDLGLAGVMIWEIGQDTDDESSLLAAVTRERALSGLSFAALESQTLRRF